MADAAGSTRRGTPLGALTNPGFPSTGQSRASSTSSHVTQVPPTECMNGRGTIAEVLVTSPITLPNTTLANHASRGFTISSSNSVSGANHRAHSKDTNVTQASPTLSSTAKSVTQAPHYEPGEATLPPATQSRSASQHEASNTMGVLSVPSISSGLVPLAHTATPNDTLSSLSATHSADPLSVTQSPCEANVVAGVSPMSNEGRATVHASEAERPIPVTSQGVSEKCDTVNASQKGKEEEKKNSESGVTADKKTSQYNAEDMHTPLPFPDFSPPVSPTAASKEAAPEAMPATGSNDASKVKDTTQGKAAEAVITINTSNSNKTSPRVGLPSHHDTPRTTPLQKDTPLTHGVVPNNNTSTTTSNNSANVKATQVKPPPIPLRPPVQVTHNPDAQLALPSFTQSITGLLPSSTTQPNAMTTSNSNNHQNLFASFCNMNASGSSTALDEVQWSLHLIKSVNDNHAATTDDCMSDQLYRLLRSPPSCALGNTDDFRVFFRTLMTVYRHDDLLPWETVVWLLRPGDQIRYRSMYAPMQCIDLEDFLRFVELASVRLRRV